MTDGRFVIGTSPLEGGVGGNFGNAILNKQNDLVVMDWMMHMILMGKGFQVRAGTITTPLVGDVVITDTAAEMCVDAAAGYTIIPMGMFISARLATGTLHEYAVKSVDAVSSAGTAFVPLPLRSRSAGGIAAVAAATTARVGAAGGVTVTAELATTTRRHWSWANPVAAGAGNEVQIPQWEPIRPPVIVGAGCLYVQVAATTTGPSYYANLDYIENVTSALV